MKLRRCKRMSTDRSPSPPPPFVLGDPSQSRLAKRRLFKAFAPCTPPCTLTSHFDATTQQFVELLDVDTPQTTVAGLRCQFCDVNFTTLHSYVIHTASSRHEGNRNDQVGLLPDITPPIMPPVRRQNAVNERSLPDI